MRPYEQLNNHIARGAAAGAYSVAAQDAGGARVGEQGGYEGFVVDSAGHDGLLGFWMM